MAPLLTKDVLEVIAPYAAGGACPDSKDARVLLNRIHEHLCLRGAKGSLQKWCLYAHDGVFTVPDDMELPLKYIDNGKVSKVWDHRAEFLMQANDYECSIGVEGMIQDINTYYTAYDGPHKPFRVLAKPMGCEDETCDPHIIIKGTTPDGEIVRSHFNEKPIEGERLKISYDHPRYTQCKYSPILGQIVKSETKYPVELRWYIPETDEEGFLALLPAKNQVTTFNRFRLKDNCVGCHKLIVLGRIKLKTYYEDNDVLPFTLMDLYINTADMFRLRHTNQLDVAQGKEGIIERTIANQNEYSKTPTSTLSISVATLPRRRNVIFGRSRGRRF